MSTLILSEFNPLNANFTKWSNTTIQFVGKLRTNCLSVFDHFVELALKVLSKRNNLIFSEIIGKTLQAVEVNYLAQIYLILEGKFGD